MSGRGTVFRLSAGVEKMNFIIGELFFFLWCPLMYTLIGKQYDSNLFVQSDSKSRHYCLLYKSDFSLIGLSLKFFLFSCSSEKIKERLNIPQDLTIGYQVSMFLWFLFIILFTSPFLCFCIMLSMVLLKKVGGGIPQNTSRLYRFVISTGNQISWVSTWG